MLFGVVRPCGSRLSALAGGPCQLCVWRRPWLPAGLMETVELLVCFLSKVFLFWQCFVFETQPKPLWRAPPTEL